MDAFQVWFDKPNNQKQLLLEAKTDFESHIITPKIRRLLQDTTEKTALEIGYGGGRLVNTASEYFMWVIGIDIHEEAELVTSFLKANGKHNVMLLKTSGKIINVEPNSIDFIYSFAVFQHLSSFEVFRNYIGETYRCLKPGGIAQIYYGSFCKLSLIQKIWNHKQQYLELNAPTNQTTLIIRKSLVIETAEREGFKVIETGFSHKKDPAVRGGQEYITVVK